MQLLDNIITVQLDNFEKKSVLMIQSMYLGFFSKLLI